MIMERVLNPRDEKQTIYEIYRACRLCGAGAGYKMPIIQNVVDLDGDGVELRQKIKECVQIEVNHTDRMPPLICELCVDKVNDFYEFLDMCKQNNKRTRLRLGLPLQTRKHDSVDSENCILGVTESMFIDSDTEPMTRQKSKKIVMKKEPAKIENRPSPKPEQKPRPSESRESSEEPRWANMPRSKKRAPSPIPKRTTRQNAEVPCLNQTESLPLTERKLKRPREKETKMDTPPPPKIVKIAPEPVKATKAGPKSSKIAQKEPPKTTPKALKPLPASKAASKALPSKALPSKALPSKALPSKALPSKATLSPEVTKAFYCRICKLQTKTSQGYAQHNSKHIPAFTSSKHACNACELWFSTVEETNTHHKNHKNQNIPYKCTRCYGYFKLQQAYEDHFGSDLCLSVYEVPDVKCWECWRTFPTSKLMEEHKCPGEDGRPGGKCNKCRRSYALLKNLLKHENICTHKKKGEVQVDPEIKARLLLMQVRIARCDPLITAGDHVDSSKVSHTYGLDSKCQYPYLPHVQVKPEPLVFDHMVAINEDIKEEFSHSHVHWDSDSSDVSGTASADTDRQKNVDSLSVISLRTIFSKRCMGRVPRRKRTVKSDAFDSFNVDFELGAKIENIIDNLSNDGTQTSIDSDSILDEVDAQNRFKNDSENDFNKDGNASLAIKDDSPTGSFDSESILDKNKSDVAEKVEDSKENDDTSEKRDDTTEIQDYASEKMDGTSEKQDDTSKKQDDTSKKQDDTSKKQDDTSEKLNDSSEKRDDMTEIQDYASEKMDGTCEKQDDTSEIQDHTSEKQDNTSEKQDDTSEIQDDTSEKRDEASAECISTPDKLETSNVLKDSENEINCENEKSAKNDDYLKSFVDNTAAISNESIDEVFDENTENLNQDNSQNDDKITKNHDTNADRKELDTNIIETDLSNENDSKNGILDSNNQFFDNIENLESDNNGVHNVPDVITSNDSDKMDVDQNLNDDTVKKTVSSEYKIQETPSDNNENFSKIDEITSKILENQTLQEAKDIHVDTYDIYGKESHSDSISLHSVCDNGVENRDKYNLNDLSEDDRILMAELDAQIGENYQSHGQNDQSLGVFSENDEKISKNDQSHGENDQSFGEFSENDEKISKNDGNSENTQKKERLIDNLLRKQELELRSLDLDRVSDDEYNFDA